MSLFHALLTIALGAAVALWLAPRLIGWARARRVLLDFPSSRRVHERVVPRVGGIAIMAALVVGSAAGHLLDPGSSVGAWLLAASLFFGVGLLDDLTTLTPARKLLLQLLAIAGALLLGLRWRGEGLGALPDLPLAGWNTIGTGLWILVVLQVINFLDGIDLIVLSVSTVVFVACVLAGAGGGGGSLFAITLGSVLGATVYNYPPARLFLGDAGSHLLGFLVAAGALTRDPHVERALPWPVIVAMLLPALTDIAMGFASKFRLGLSFTEAHKEHLYQRLTHVHGTHARVAGRYALVTVACLAATLGLSRLNHAVWAPAAVGTIVLAHVLDGRRRTGRHRTRLQSSHQKPPR